MHDGEHSVKGQPTCLEFKKGHTQIRYKIPLFPSPDFRLILITENQKYIQSYTIFSLNEFSFWWKKRGCVWRRVIAWWLSPGEQIGNNNYLERIQRNKKNKSHYSACWRSVRIYKRCVPGRIKFEKKIKGLGRLGYYYGGRILVEVEEDS
jgi:hypothetical protein